MMVIRLNFKSLQSTVFYTIISNLKKRILEIPALIVESGFFTIRNLIKKCPPM
jgi:hypothetical protein